MSGDSVEGANDELFIGLISGTSVDGIDAALVSFEPALKLRHALTAAMPEALAADILRVSQAEATVSLDFLGQLDTRVGMVFADAVERLLAEAGVDRGQVRAIGSHGQTLRHRPHGDAPFTLQVGDGNVIAERCGIATVADFRRRDVAAGGQGAPLVPAFHAAMFRDDGEDRAVLNIGGIANFTLLAASAHPATEGSAEPHAALGHPCPAPRHGDVRGFDTGPGNGLMDAWCLRHRGQRYDAGGSFAAAGRVDEALLAGLLEDPWLALPAPKSTGRDHFHLEWLQSRLEQVNLPPEDVQATLCLFTARSIAQALQREQAGTKRVLVCGGGVHNPVLLANLRSELPGVAVESTSAHGLDPDFVEAMAFAWLARETLAGRPGNLASVTGARGPRILGTIFPV